MRQYRQGDVLLTEVELLPEGASLIEPAQRLRQSSHVLAEGGASGHRHQIAADGAAALFSVHGHADLYLVVRGREIALRHEEHAPLIVPNGIYRVIRQREFSTAAAEAERLGWDTRGD